MSPAVTRGQVRRGTATLLPPPPAATAAQIPYTDPIPAIDQSTAIIQADQPQSQGQISGPLYYPTSPSSSPNASSDGEPEVGPLLDIAPQGDLFLCVGPQKQMMRVSATLLCAASKYFETVLTGADWAGNKITAEGVKNPDGKILYTESDPLELPDDEARAFADLCYVIHYKSGSIKSARDGAWLRRLVIVADKYVCTHVIRDFIGRLLNDRAHFLNHSHLGSGDIFVLAWLVRDYTTFKDASERVLLRSFYDYMDDLDPDLRVIFTAHGGEKLIEQMKEWRRKTREALARLMTKPLIEWAKSRSNPRISPCDHYKNMVSQWNDYLAAEDLLLADEAEDGIDRRVPLLWKSLNRFWSSDDPHPLWGNNRKCLEALNCEFCTAPKSDITTVVRGMIFPDSRLLRERFCGLCLLCFDEQKVQLEWNCAEHFQDGAQFYARVVGTIKK